jgi:small subunit ribosomal protein S27e
MSRWTDLIPKPRSKFLRVKCSECGNEQVVFGNASTSVRCHVCDGILAEPTGGRTKIRGEIVDVYD